MIWLERGAPRISRDTSPIERRSKPPDGPRTANIIAVAKEPLLSWAMSRSMGHMGSRNSYPPKRPWSVAWFASDSADQVHP